MFPVSRRWGRLNIRHKTDVIRQSISNLPEDQVRIYFFISAMNNNLDTHIDFSIIIIIFVADYFSSMGRGTKY